MTSITDEQNFVDTNFNTIKQFELSSFDELATIVIVVYTHFHTLSVLCLFLHYLMQSLRKYPVRHYSNLLSNIYFHVLQDLFFNDGNDFYKRLYYFSTVVAVIY